MKKLFARILIWFYSTMEKKYKSLEKEQERSLKFKKMEHEKIFSDLLKADPYDHQAAHYEIERWGLYWDKEFEKLCSLRDKRHRYWEKSYELKRKYIWTY